jgi:hypothetical protein
MAAARILPACLRARALGIRVFAWRGYTNGKRLHATGAYARYSAAGWLARIVSAYQRAEVLGVRFCVS